MQRHRGKRSPADVMTCESRTRPLVERQTGRRAVMDAQTGSQASGPTGRVHCRHGTMLSALDDGPSPSRKMPTQHVDTRGDGPTTLTNGRRGGRATDRTTNRAGLGRVAAVAAVAVSDDDDDDDSEANTTHVDQQRQSDARTDHTGTAQPATNADP